MSDEAPRKPGRPTTLTDVVAEKIIAYVEAGNYVLTAAAACGISRRSFYDWMKRGRAELDALEGGAEPEPNEELFADFAARVEIATAAAEIAALKDVRSATERWQAAMTYLERRFPDRWGRRQAIEHSGPQGGAIALRALRPEEIASANEETLKMIAEGRALPQGADGGQVHPSDESGSDSSAERAGSES
jgi:transposase